MQIWPEHSDERTRAGLNAARARGRKGGWPRAAVFADPNKRPLPKKLYDEKQPPVGTICTILKISRVIFYGDMNSAAKAEKGAANA